MNFELIFELISKVLINVLFISMFISILFFTYGVTIERNVIINQMKILSNNFMSHIELSGNKINKDMYNYNVNTLLNPENIKAISAGDEKALERNKPILKSVITLISGFFVIVSIIIWLFYVTGNLKLESLLEILLESFIILIFIAIAELAFFKFFGAEFISVDTNVIKSGIFEELKEYSKELKNDLAH